jgi:hypothetical protein
MGECYSVGEEEVKEDGKTVWVLRKISWVALDKVLVAFCILLYSGQCISGVRVSLAFGLPIVS